MLNKIDSFSFETILKNGNSHAINKMNSSALNPATHATSLFLLRDEDNSEIVTPSLLLPFNQDNPAIMTATHAQNLLLPFYQNESAIMTATHANFLLLPVRDGPAIMMATHATHANLSLLSVRDDPAITMTNHANPKLQLIVECLFLLRNKDNSETMTSSLLLFCVKDAPAIMMVPLANFSLQLIVESFSTGAKQASVCNNSFKLIVNVIPASEGAATFLYILGDYSLNETTKFTVASQAMVLSMTIGDKSNGSLKLDCRLYFISIFGGRTSSHETSSSNSSEILSSDPSRYPSKTPSHNPSEIPLSDPSKTPSSHFSHHSQ